MTKTDKNTDHLIRVALTEVCDIALENIAGFIWLTHQVPNYKTLPECLSITCVFETDEAARLACNLKHQLSIYELISEKLSSLNIKVKNIQQQVNFDSEEACQRQHNGNWKKRLSN